MKNEKEYNKIIHHVLKMKKKKKNSTYRDDPIRMYACHGNDPKPASSPPTIRRCAVCLAIDIPQPIRCDHSKK